MLAARGTPAHPGRYCKNFGQLAEAEAYCNRLLDLPSAQVRPRRVAAPRMRSRTHAMAHSLALLCLRGISSRAAEAHTHRSGGRAGWATVGALRRPPHAERPFAERCTSSHRDGLHGGFQEKDDAKALLREIRSVQQHQRVVGMAE